jgi:hypothetical protein
LPPGPALPTFPLPVSPVAWDISVLVVGAHHPPIHISLKDPNQYPCRPHSLFQKLIKKA